MSASKNWQDKMKSLSSVLTAKQVAHAVRISSNELPKWEDYIEWASNDRHVIMRDLAVRHPDWTEEQCEEKAMEMESDTVSEEMNKAWDALESAANDEFAKHGLELTRVEGKWGPNEDDGPLFEVTPVKSWEDAAAKIVDTINGVGEFHFSSVKEFLRSGPYTARQAVLSHLGYIGWRAEVYGDYGARHRYESARRNPGHRRRNPADPTYAQRLMRNIPGVDPRIKTTYEIVTPESAEDGDVAERGWVDDEGVSMMPDEEIPAERLGNAVVEKAVAFLQYEGATEPSSHPFHPGTWYSWADDQVNYRTGEYRRQSYHLYGFTPEQEREIYAQVTRRRNPAAATVAALRLGKGPRRNPHRRKVMRALAGRLEDPSVECYNIEWDLEGASGGHPPSSLTIVADGFRGTEAELHDWMDSHGADILSDITGWLVDSYEWRLE